MKTWYPLTFNLDDIMRKDWVFPKPYSRFMSTYVVNADDIFIPEWLSELRSRGFVISVTRLFHRGRNHNEDVAHVDHFIIKHNRLLSYAKFGINFVIGGSDSEMVWYELPEHLRPPTDLVITEEQYDYWVPRNCVEWKMEDLGPIVDRCKVGKQGVLVNVSVPHRIVMGTEPRWCISLRPMHSEWDFNDAFEAMKEKQFLKQD